MNKPQLVVMAAGMGSRYGGLKQLDSFGPSGERVIDYALYDALSAGFERIVFVIRRDIEEPFRAGVGSIMESRAEVRYVFQEIDRVPAWFKVPADRSKPWGTAHAVLCAADAVNAPFAVINADDYYGCDSFRVLYNWLERAGSALGGSMVGFTLENTLSEHGDVSRGVCTVSAEGNLESVVERTKIRRIPTGVGYGGPQEGSWIDLPPQSVVSMNMWGFTPVFMSALQSYFELFLKEQGTAGVKTECYLPSVVNALITRNEMTVAVLPTQSKWFGVTYEQDKQSVRDALSALVAAQKYPRSLWA